MTGYRCPGSEEIVLHPPAECPGGGAPEAVELCGRGTVYSCTTLHAAAAAFEKDLPFQIAIIELEEGLRLTARIEGPRVGIGDRVRLAGERDGVQFFTSEV